MNSDSYSQCYFSLQASLFQTELSLLVSKEVFHKFPENLPERQRNEMSEAARVFGKVLTDFASACDEPMADEKNVVSSSHDLRRVKGLGSPFVMAVMAQFMSKSSAEIEFDFQQSIVTQHLSLAFAYADAFTTETLKAILTICPDRLRTKKNITWQQIMELGSWESLQTHFVDSLCLEFGFQSLADRAAAFENDFGIKLSVSKNKLDQIHEAELMRNFLMHAGGVVNAEYERRSRLKIRKRGDRVILSVEAVSKIIDQILSICLALFDGVYRHFYRKNPERLSGIFRYSEVSEDFVI